MIHFQVYHNHGTTKLSYTMISSTHKTL